MQQIRNTLFAFGSYVDWKIFFVHIFIQSEMDVTVEVDFSLKITVLTGVVILNAIYVHSDLTKQTKQFKKCLIIC